MKAFAIISFCLSFILSSAQVKLGMSKYYNISPSTATVSTAGIAYDSTYVLNCTIKNTGNVSYSGFITYYARVDSSTNNGPITSNSFVVVSNFAPNDSVSIGIVDTIKPNTFSKVGGNGNTIVVWPFVSGIEITDTLETDPVYVQDITGIEKFGLKQLQLYPNPGKDKLFIKPGTGDIYDKLIIYDLQMRKVREENFKEEVNISAMPQGTYWINVKAKSGKIYTAMFTKME